MSFPVYQHISLGEHRMHSTNSGMDASDSQETQTIEAPNVTQSPETKSSNTITKFAALPVLATVGAIATHVVRESLTENILALPMAAEPENRLIPYVKTSAENFMSSDDFGDSFASNFINGIGSAASYASGQMWSDIGDTVSSVYQHVMSGTDGVLDTKEEVSQVANNVFDNMHEVVKSLNDTKMAAGVVSIGVGAVPFVYGCNQLVSGLNDLVPVHFQFKDKELNIRIENKFSEGMDKISKGALAIGVGTLSIMGGASTITGKEPTGSYLVNKAAEYVAAVPNAIIDTCGAGLISATLIGTGLYMASTVKAELSVSNFLRAATATAMFGLSAFQLHAYLD